MEKLNDFLLTLNQPMSIRFKKKLYDKGWVVYAKEPFGGPKQVIEYLGRYSHKIAISNHRIKEIENSKIVFSYKDYANGGIQRLINAFRCGRIFTKFLFAHIASKVYENKALRHFSKQNKTKTENATDEDGRSYYKKRKTRLEGDN